MPSPGRWQKDHEEEQQVPRQIMEDAAGEGAFQAEKTAYAKA